MVGLAPGEGKVRLYNTIEVNMKLNIIKRSSNQCHFKQQKDSFANILTL